MQLTEQQIADRDELFFTIINEFVEDNYEIDDDYEMTEEDAYITSIVMDYFEENFKYPTLQESALEDITGYDINENLYKELAEILIDESVGGFIAGAVHGIRNTFSGIKADSARAKKEKAENKFGKHTVGGFKSKKGIDKQKMAVDVAQKAHDTKDFGKGNIGGFKKSFSQSKIDATRKRADNAKKALINARNKSNTASKTHEQGLLKRNQLKDRIDNGIKNVKSRVKSAITTGAQHIGGFMGRVAGHLAT